MGDPVYLDCNATTPIDPRVAEVVHRYLNEEFGNAGSRTHELGATAKRAVERAREQVASVVGAKPDEVFFTSGATESNNLALLGLGREGETSNRRHIVSTAIEHKAVLEPLGALQARGFEITIVSPTNGGWVDAHAVKDAIRPDTLLVSVMDANNETGVIQPIADIAAALGDHPAYFHVDAAQGFGKDLEALRTPRIDLLSASGHKLFAPKGIGALVARRRGFERPPLSPVLYGGGQERGLRPGTLPVPLIAGFGLACKLAVEEADCRRERCRGYRREVLAALEPLGFVQNGDEERCMPHVLNLSFPGVDSEALMVALKGMVAISNGSACTSSSYEPSHVLKGMGCTDAQAQQAVRLSWCHRTDGVDWSRVSAAIRALL
jgi:cysteine desulfurase